MSEDTSGLGAEITVDQSNLYREENYTDLKVASLRRLIPVTPSGEDDPGREPLYMAQTQVMSQLGAIPVQAPLEAKTLEAALAEFPGAIRKAVDRLVEEVREMQRQEASRIVVPSGGLPGAPGGGLGGAGGGRIVG